MQSSEGQEKLKRVFSGVQPTGKLHIGNYVGALSVWVEHQRMYDNIFCVVDLHALTIPENVNPAALYEKSREVAALYLACGIDSDECAIFLQSSVLEHAQLAWILNCVTPVGWLERMTQYKSKSSQMKTISTGLLDYPVLQAADILLYDTDLVPVGEDQRQHVELTRDIAERFNHLFGLAFVLPEVMIRKSGARIMAFDEPTAKMSKSIGEVKAGHSIGLLDGAEAVKKTIMSAVTDSMSEVRPGSASPGVANLLILFEVLAGVTRQAVEERFAGKSYGVLKREVADIVISALEPIQTRYKEIRREPAYLEEILAKGADRVRPIAQRTVTRVQELTGLG